MVVVVEQTYSDCWILLTLSLKLGGKFRIELVSFIYFMSIKQIDYLGRNFCWTTQWSLNDRSTNYLNFVFPFRKYLPQYCWGQGLSALLVWPDGSFWDSGWTTLIKASDRYGGHHWLKPLTAMVNTSDIHGGHMWRKAFDNNWGHLLWITMKSMEDTFDGHHWKLWWTPTT